MFATKRWGNNLTWADWVEWLERCATSVLPGELHGLFSGIIAGGLGLSSTELLRLVHKYIGTDEPLCAELLSGIGLLYQGIVGQMADPELGYCLGIPEEADLERQIHELAHWCQGFLVGVGTALRGVADQDLDPLVREALADIAEVAQVDISQLEDQTEFSLMEIEEYLKVAVLVIYENAQERIHKVDLQSVGRQQ